VTADPYEFGAPGLLAAEFERHRVVVTEEEQDTVVDDTAAGRRGLHNPAMDSRCSPI
jgi:hypothetical protein